MPEWKVGDRVISVVDHPDYNSSIVFGASGYVCGFSKERADQGFRAVGVCWDDNIDGGHGCHGDCEWGHGWFMYEDELEPEPTDEPFEFNEGEFRLLIFGGVE